MLRNNNQACISHGSVCTEPGTSQPPDRLCPCVAISCAACPVYKHEGICTECRTNSTKLFVRDPIRISRSYSYVTVRIARRYSYVTVRIARRYSYVTVRIATALMIKVMAADLRKCCSEDDLPTAP